MAAELQKRIQDGRARQAEQAKQIAAAVERATASDPTYQPFAPAPEERDAGSGAADAGVEQPTAGMTIADFTRKFSRCFAPHEDIQVQGRGLSQTFVLQDNAGCRTRHSAFVGKALLFENSKLYGTGELSQMQRRLPDGGEPAASDAGR